MLGQLLAQNGTKVPGIEDLKMTNLKQWWSFDGVDLPQWMTENDAKTMCSLLNFYIPKEHSTHGTRYHVLNHYEGGLYFHLLNRPLCTYYPEKMWPMVQEFEKTGRIG